MDMDKTLYQETFSHLRLSREKKEELLQLNTKKNKSRAPRRLAATAAAIAAVVVALFCVNAAAPALAEELPIIGGIFKRMHTEGSNAATYDDVLRPIGVKAANDTYSVTVDEAYTDGENLFFTLNLESQDAALMQKDNLYPWNTDTDWDDAWTVTVNDMVIRGSIDSRYYIGFEKKDDHFEGVGQMPLPLQVSDGARLHIEIQWDNLLGSTRADVFNGEFGDVIPAGVDLAFDLTADLSHNTETAATLAAPGGLTLNGWSSTPAYFKVRVSFPYYGGAPAAAAVTDSGDRLTYAVQYDYPEALNGLDFGDEAHLTIVYNGVPAGTKRVKITLFNTTPYPENPGDYAEYVNGGLIGPAAFGEFTIDLESGGAEATETYREAGFDFLSVSEYAKRWEAGPAYREHIFVGARDINPCNGWDPDDPSSPKNGALEISVQICSDTEADLPYEARFFLHGKQAASVPFCKASAALLAETMDHAKGYRLVGDDCDTRTYIVDSDDYAAYIGGWRRTKRVYNVTAYLLDTPCTALEAASIWDNGDGYVQIVDPATEKVIYDSRRIPEVTYEKAFTQREDRS